MIKTVTLKSGHEVLAKYYKDELCAVTYTNRTQAYRKAAALGEGWEAISAGRPWFVARRWASLRFAGITTSPQTVIVGIPATQPVVPAVDNV